MGDHDNLGVFPDDLQQIVESVHVGLVQRRIDFIQQTKRGGFFLALSGSFALMVAAFAHGYRTMAVGAFNTGEPYLYPITPLREHTLPIVAVSVFFLVLGYGVMLRRVGLD